MRKTGGSSGLPVARFKRFLRGADIVNVVLTNTSIWQHGIQPEERYHSLFIENGRISALSHESKPNIPGGFTELRLDGGLLLPAFFDAHLHLDQGGRYLSRLKLLDAYSSGEVLRRLKEAVPNHGDWIIGIGLRHRSIPAMEDFHHAKTGTPVILYTRDYHSALLNRFAMELIGLTAETRLPDGGWLEYAPDGNPSGFLHENAVMWVEGRIPPETSSELRGHIERAQEYLVKLGILGVSDAGHRDTWPILHQMESSGKLKLRVESWARCLDFSEECLQMPRGESENLRRSRIKLFLDGSLGSGTAWMKQPYLDTPAKEPVPVPDLEVFREFCEKATRAGWSLTVHAIGDAAVEFTVDLLDALPAPGGLHRIEHFQHTDERCLERFRQMKIIPSIQPFHRIEDLELLPEKLSNDCLRYSFPQRSLKNRSGLLALGSDWPVVDPDPLKTISAAIARRLPGQGMPGEELSLDDAILGLTAHSAKAAGFRNTGCIQPGYPADLVWLKSGHLTENIDWDQVELGTVWKRGDMVHTE